MAGEMRGALLRGCANLKPPGASGNGAPSTKKRPGPQSQQSTFFTREVAHTMRPELDACGIGFVADAQGRSSRAIVEAALNGLACVKHRGAVAADAKSADGSGVNIPIPAAIFGEGHGLVMLFVRGDDPRPAVETAAREEGIEVVDWREPPVDDDQLGDQARAFRPRFLQAVIAHPTRDERAAFRMRKRIQAATTGTYVASCSFRTVVYKGLVA